MKAFPFEKLTVRKAELSSTLSYNPYTDYSPRERWNIGIAINLGLAAVAPEVETAVESRIVISELDLPIRSWKHLPGHYDFTEPQDGGSFYDTQLHNPVDVRSVEIQSLGFTRFELGLALDFYFELENYRDQSVGLYFEADYRGFTFVTPIWNNPEEIDFPPEWEIPSSMSIWKRVDVERFVSRYVDFSAFSRVEIEETTQHTILRALP